jgi:hypothetical protein
MVILCFSKHRLQKDQIAHINIKHYKLADGFCRKRDKNGISCISVWDVINVKEVSFLRNLEREKELISATELVDFKIIAICIYI